MPQTIKRNIKRIPLSRLNRRSYIQKTIKEIIGKSWFYVFSAFSLCVTLIGGFDDIRSFLERWPQNNGTTITYVLAFLWAILLVLSIFAILKLKDKLNRIKTILLYGFTLILILLPLGFWQYTVKQNQSLEEKVIIVVTTFNGPETQYHITDMIIENLTSKLQGYDDTLIITLPDMISQSDDRNDLAREIGEKYHADLLLWGWYGVTDTDVMVTIHIENFINPNKFSDASSLAEASNFLDSPLPSTYTYVPQATLAEINEFTLQQRLAGEMGSLTLFVSGLTRFKAGDYQNAVDRLTEALETTAWPDEIVNKQDLLNTRGVANLKLGNYEASMADFNAVLGLNPDSAIARTNRGVLYLLAGNYEQAEQDFSLSLLIANENPYNVITLSNRASIYILQQRYDDALADIDQALSMNTEGSLVVYRSILYSQRSSYFLMAGDYNQAIEDASQAIQLNQELSIAYLNRCSAYFFAAEYDAAIRDCSETIHLLKVDSMFTTSEQIFTYLYFERGSAYLMDGNYRKAISDFKRAVKIDPGFFLAYGNMGYAYLLQHSYPMAIEAFNEGLDNFTMIPGLELSEDAATSFQASYYLGRGQAYIATGQVQLGLSDLQLCIVLTDNDQIESAAKQILRQYGIYP